MEFWLPYALCLVILAGEIQSRGRRRIGAPRKDAGSFGVIAILYPLAYAGAFTLRGRPPLLGAWASAVGAALAVFGTAFRFWSIRVLGDYFTRMVQVSSDQRIVENGPYRRIRHPAYAGSLIASLGVALSLRSLESLICLMSLAIIATGYRILVEERALAKVLGEPYRSYARRTRRVIPFIV